MSSRSLTRNGRHEKLRIAMDSTTRRTLDRVRELVTTHLGGLDVRVYLFGSFARGDTHRFSDIDVAVDSDGPLPAGTLPRLREAFEESTIPRHVEIVDLTTAEAGFRARVLAEGVTCDVSRSA